MFLNHWWSRSLGHNCFTWHRWIKSDKSVMHNNISTLLFGNSVTLKHSRKPCHWLYDWIIGYITITQIWSNHKISIVLLCVYLSLFASQLCIKSDRHYTSTHWGRVTHICVGKLTIIGSDNGLSPVRRQAIIWTNAGILFIRPLTKSKHFHWIKYVWKCRLWIVVGLNILNC